MHRVALRVARTSETALRRLTPLSPARTPVLLLIARVIGPSLTAIERFLDAREQAFRERGWI